MRVGHLLGITISGVIWLIIGAFLTFKGLSLVGVALLVEDKGPLISFFDQLVNNIERAGMFLIFFSLAIGMFKGRFVLSKTVHRSVKRLLLTPSPLKLKDLFPLNYLLLIGGMMLLGMTLRFLPIPLDVRGCIDVAIGSALINGAFLYFKQVLLLKAEYARKKK